METHLRTNGGVQVCCHNCKHIYPTDDYRLDCRRVACLGPGFPFQSGEMLIDCFEPRKPDTGRTEG